MNEASRLAAGDLPMSCQVLSDALLDQATAAVTEATTAAEVASRRSSVAERLPFWLLRAGLAFVLSYAAASSFFHPETFARYFPSFMPAGWTTELLPAFAVWEMLLVVGLMTDRFTYPASMGAALTLVAIIVVNPDAFEVLFRNVAIACSALAVAVQSRRDRAEPAERSSG